MGSKRKHDQSLAMDANPSAANASSLADPALLDKIDRLFQCNVGQWIPLPQLVVVGDQSSGKSSVLEGLTGLPFPRDAGLCTRFATQITFRRAAEDFINISILPCKNASPEHAAKVGEWHRKDLKDLTAKEFGKIVMQVSQIQLQAAERALTSLRLKRRWELLKDPRPPSQTTY